MAISHTLEDGIAEVVMHHPPVNAITVGDTWKIRDTFEELSRDPELRAVILTAEGKGFNAGIDIKEMQGADGFEHLLSMVDQGQEPEDDYELDFDGLAVYVNARQHDRLDHGLRPPQNAARGTHLHGRAGLGGLFLGVGPEGGEAGGETQVARVERGLFSQPERLVGEGENHDERLALGYRRVACVQA